MDANADAPTTDTKAHEMRITQGGNMRNWISFALKFLEENETRPLVLHTSPPKVDTNVDVETEAPTDATETVTAKTVKVTEESLHPSTSTIPRLISVVEIIKREHVNLLGLKSSHETHGLHQYNEIGCLEDDDDASKQAPNARSSHETDLARVLKSNNFLKIKRTPYMRITLSRKPLGDTVGKETYQQPMKRKMSKSAKTRAKKRARKLEQAKQAPEEEL